MEKSVTFSGTYVQVSTNQGGATLVHPGPDKQAVAVFVPQNAEHAHELAKAFGILRRRMLGLASHFERLDADE